MIDKKTYIEKFLGLPSGERTRLRVYMALMAVNNSLIFAFSKYGIFSFVGILFNTILIYWSANLKSANFLYYGLIFWSFWIVLIFNGSYFIYSIFKNPTIEVSLIGTVINLFLISFFGRPIWRYRKTLQSTESKSARTFSSPLASSRSLPALTLAEEKRIKFCVRMTGVLLIMWGMINWTFSDRLQSYGMRPEEPVVISIGLIAALGLLLFRQNLGRRFCLFVCFVIWAGGLLVIFDKRVFGVWGYCYSITLILIFLTVFLFLLHPKAKAVFK